MIRRISKARKDGRFIPLSDFFIKALQNYTAFLKQITSAYGSFLKHVFAKKKLLSMIYLERLLIVKISCRCLLDSGRAGKLNCSLYLETGWMPICKGSCQKICIRTGYVIWYELIDAWTRRKNSFSLSSNSGLFGHDQRDREIFHPHSSLIPNMYVKQARRHLQDNVKSLSVQHLERK